MPNTTSKYKPLVSVIIPAYNRHNLLQRALDSVLCQSYANTEIIVVDDGSNPPIKQKLRNQDRVVRLPANQGVSRARNHGILISRGQWVALLDSDDQWYPQKLEYQLQAVAQQPEMSIWQCNEQWIRNQQPVATLKKHQKKHGDIFADSVANCVITPSATLMKVWLAKNNLFDVHLPACEDYDLWLRLSNSYQVGLVEDKLLNRYQGHEQLSQTYPAMDRFRVYALFKAIGYARNTALIRHKLLSLLHVLKVGRIKRNNEIKNTDTLIAKANSLKALHNTDKFFLLNHTNWS